GAPACVEDDHGPRGGRGVAADADARAIGNDDAHAAATHVALDHAGRVAEQPRRGARAARVGADELADGLQPVLTEPHLRHAPSPSAPRGPPPPARWLAASLRS